jgi:hypothetical protein
MRLQKHLKESYKQDIEFIKKRLILYVNDIEHNISVMKKTEIKDQKDSTSLSKIYKELDKKIKDIKTSINNYKIDEMFEPDVMSKNIIRIQLKSIERDLQILDNKLEKEFIKKKPVSNKLKSSFISIWNTLQNIYKIIGGRKK